MKRILLISALVLGLGAQAQDNARLQYMGDMEYVDEARCYIALDSSVQSVIPMLALAWLEASDASQKSRIQEAFDVALVRGCDINAANFNGLAALHLAIIKGDGDFVQYLLAHGADPKLHIESTTVELNGLNSFTLLELLQEKDSAVDRRHVQKALATLQ